MSRIVKLAAFNIVTHPHTAKGYADLFAKARALRQPIKVWGETHAILASAYSPNKSEGVMTGEIFTFLQLDPSLDWYDVVRGEQASEEQVEEVRIPPELKPHLKKIRYAVFPRNHLFIYTREDSHYGAIAPTPMQHFLERLLNDNRLLEKTEFQEVDVRLVQDKRELAAILKAITLEKLEIFVQRPNPGDTPGEAEDQVTKEMEEENLEELKIIKKAADEDGLQPNERTQTYMEAASSNGYVWARGLSKDGVKKEFNTQDAPWIEPFEFPNNVPYLDRFLEAAIQLRDRILHRK